MSLYQPPRVDILPYFERLVPAYRRYCETVSKRSMAMSIESCAYLWWLCDLKGARNVCDLGSGFTSYTLRQYAEAADHDVTVTSVDSDEEWLARSAEFCGNPDGFVVGLDWARHQIGPYDVIVNDYSGGVARDQFATLAASRVAYRGAVMFDDAHHAGHHDHMAEVCIGYDLTFLDIYHQTVDEVGRFAALGARL